MTQAYTRSQIADIGSLIATQMVGTSNTEPLQVHMRLLLQESFRKLADAILEGYSIVPLSRVEADMILEDIQNISGRNMTDLEFKISKLLER